MQDKINDMHKDIGRLEGRVDSLERGHHELRSHMEQRLTKIDLNIEKIFESITETKTRQDVSWLMVSKMGSVIGAIVGVVVYIIEKI